MTSAVVCQDRKIIFLVINKWKGATAFYKQMERLDRIPFEGPEHNDAFRQNISYKLSRKVITQRNEDFVVEPLEGDAQNPLHKL